MTINKTINGTELLLTIAGRLDTATAPNLEKEIEENIEGVEMLILDCASLDYISSASLRVILVAQKMMNKQGKMIVRNINQTIEEIFEITGFCDVLNIE